MNELLAKSSDAAQRKRLRRAVNRLVQAEISNSWKGGGDPDFIPDIEHELKLAKAHYLKVLNEVFNENQNGFLSK